MIEWIIANKLWFILGFGALFNFCWLSQYRKRLRMSVWMAALLSLAHMICAVLCAKIFAFMEGVPGGMSLYGGLFFLPVLFCGIALLTKRSIADACDVFTIPNIVTVFCARLNCIFSGCCLGKVIPGTDGIRWPTREIELVLYVVLYIVLRNKIRKKHFEGKLYPIYMISYGTFRFIVEFFRESEHDFGWFHISHLWSLIAMAVGAGIYMSISRKTKDSMKRGKRSGRAIRH